MADIKISALPTATTPLTGAELVPIVQSGVTKQTTVNSISTFVTPQMYGAVADGVTNDTAAMQAAHNTGHVVFYPSGDYLFTQISFSSGGIVGMGPGQSNLYSTDNTTNDIITFTGTGGAGEVPVFKDFKLQALNNKTAGANLHINPSSGVLEYMDMYNVLIYNAFRCFELTNCTFGGMTRCNALNYTDAGIYYKVPNDVGAGDFLIQGCHIGTGQSTGFRYGIRQISGGGLRVIGNKILGGLAGYALDYNGTLPSGPLLINGNSIENCVNFGIYLGCISSGTYGGIEIVGNEIAQISAISGICISSDVSGKISQLNITGNHLAYNGATGTSVSLNTVKDFVISSNTIVGNLGINNQGIVTTIGCNNGRLNNNIFVDIPTYKIVNSSSTTYEDTGTGNNVLATSPTLVTPILGTPQSVTLTNATSLPISTGVSGLGTGVATALAVNVGTAGSSVINGGTLGTPSSGTVTNLTGTANITATGGASGAIAATTLSASSTVSGTGFSTYLASPPAIGGTAAAALSATALSYTTTLTGGTGIVNLGSGQLYKDASGNVGIGTPSPSTKLSVVSATNAGISVSDGTVNTIIYNSTGGVASIGTTTNHPVSLYANNAERIRMDGSGNVGIGISTFGTSAAKVLGMANATAPTTSPTGMGQLYVEAGALKFRGSSGTITTIAIA